MKRADLEWERWGQKDPYFGVLTDPKYHKANIENSKADFFESGALHVANVLDQVQKHFGPIQRANALDFGCGVGRLLVPLSKEFNSVTGLDVSTSMLEEASKNLAIRQISNVELLESDDSLTRLGSRTFDFVHTYIVLQHIAPERGYRIIRNLLRHLSPEGAFFIHVSCRRNQSLARRLIYLSRSQVPFSYTLFNMLQGRRMFEPIMEMNEYDISRVFTILQQEGFPELKTRLENHGGCLTASFYSRKAHTTEDPSL